MKKKKWMILVIAVIVGVAFLSGLAKNENAADEKIDGIPVMITEVKPAIVENQFFSVSRLEAKKNILAQSSMEGTVEKVFVKAGDAVDEASPLFKVKGEDLKEKLELAVKQAGTELEEQKISYKNVEKTYHDAIKLLSEGAISKKEYDEAEEENNKAKLNVDLANKNYVTAVASSKTNLEKLIIQSPIKGMVADINVKAGELLQAESGVTIITDDRFIAKVPVTEDLIDKIEIGNPGEIYIPSKDKTYPSKIIEINQQIDRQSLSYPVTLEIIDETEDLKDGMHAEVTICIEKMTEQILVPQKSVMFEDDKTYIYKLTDHDKIKKVFVEKGIEVDGNVQITGDIRLGERIVTKGQHFIDEDSKLQIVEGDQ